MKIDQNRLERVTLEAFDRVSGNRRWETAIVKAKQQIENNPYLHFDGHSLLILSPSGEIYTANGSCQCRAAIPAGTGQPCGSRSGMKKCRAKRNGRGKCCNTHLSLYTNPSPRRKER